VTVGLAGVVGASLLFLAPVIRRAVFPVYVRAPAYKVTGQIFLYDRLLGWRNIPGRESTTFGQPLTINSRGLRGPEYPFAKPAGTRRILVLGDSYTWGYGVADKELFTMLLEEKLVADGRAFEVLNCGVSGWGTDQEYLFFREEGIRYSPDVVVLTFFFNDLSEVVASMMYGTAKPFFVLENNHLELANVPVPPPWKKQELAVSDANPFELVVAIMKELDRLCVQSGCRLVVMKFGNSLAPASERFLEMEQRFESLLARELDVPYLDLDEAFAESGLAGKKLVSVPDGHWNAAGHRETALALYRFLAENRFLD
jgi:lysophospholipase L1-like esterase